jgi:hypothetical protein
MKDCVSFIFPPSFVSYAPSLTVGLPLKGD